MVESKLARVTAVNNEKVSLNNGVGSIKIEEMCIRDSAYVEDGKITKAIDEDAKIVYIDADNQTKGDDGMGITSFDGTTGYANALIVYEGGVATNKIVAKMCIRDRPSMSES